MARSPARSPFRAARLSLVLLVAGCWSDPHDLDEAGVQPAPVGVARDEGPRPRGALPLPPAPRRAAPQATLVRPALPEPAAQPLVELVQLVPDPAPPEPAAGPQPAALAAGEVVWPAEGGGPQPTVGPRRDPVEPPLLDDEAWRSWVFAVRLNDQPVSAGSVFLESPADGRLLAGVAQLRLWRVVIDEARVLSLQGEAFYPLDAIPGLTATIDRRALEIALSVPADSLEAFVADADQADAPAPASGFGGFLDYDILASGGDSLDQRLDGLLELGAFGRLGVLSSGLLADDLLADPELTRLETTFTRDLPDSRASLRLGDSLTGGGALAQPVRFGGLQWATNFATDPTFVTFPVPAIGGLAEESSVVDVFVDNLRQATTDVPAGPFQINNIPVVTGAGEVQLVVRDLLGRETIVTQPYYISSRMLREGLHDYSYELGLLRRRYGERSFDYGDPVAAATHRYGVNPFLTLEAHADAAPDVQSVAGGGLLRLDRFGVVNAAIAGSLDNGDEGIALDLGYEYLARTFSFGARTRYGSDDFAQTGDPQRGGRTDQINIGADLGRFGRIGLLAVNQDRPDEDDLRSVAATWSLQIGPGNLMLRGAQFLEPDNDYVVAAMYALPLGGQRSSSLELEKRQDGRRARAQFRQGRGATDLGFDYRLGGELGDESGADARLSYQSTRGAVDLEIESYGGDTNLRAGINGSLGLVDGTLRASRRLGRAFAVVTAPGFANVRVYLDNREVGRTDADGKLMLPQLRPYEINRLRLEVADLPLEARIGSAEAMAVPFDRSGVTVSFDVAEERQATAVLVDASGDGLPPGLRLADPAGRVAAMVAKNGFAQIVIVGAGGSAEIVGEAEGRRVACRVPELPPGIPVPDLGRIVCR